MSPAAKDDASSVLNKTAHETETPNNNKEEEGLETDKEKRFKDFWCAVVPKNLSEIPIGEELYMYPIMEVLEVCIFSNSNRRKKLQIHGAISVDASYGISTIFSRTLKNPEVVQSPMDNSLTLTGPDHASVATDYFNIIVNIMDGRQQVCKGCVCWDLHNDDYFLHNRLLVHEFNGNNFRAYVSYALFSSAILIDVQIKLPEMENYPFEMKNKKQQGFKIHGTVFAVIKTRDKKMRKRGNMLSSRQKKEKEEGQRQGKVQGDGQVEKEKEKEEEEEGQRQGKVQGDGQVEKEKEEEEEGQGVREVEKEKEEEEEQGMGEVEKDEEEQVKEREEDGYEEDEEEEWVIRDVLTTTLFRRKPTNSANVCAKGDHLLPLTKSLIAFPENAVFQISLNLKEHSPIQSCDSTIANTVVTCTPTHFGDTKYSIKSKYGVIELKLCAYPLNMHPNTYAALKKSFYPQFQ